MTTKTTNNVNKRKQEDFKMITKLTNNLCVADRTTSDNRACRNKEDYQDQSLNWSDYAFLNPFAFNKADPYSNAFWTEMRRNLASESRKAEGCRKSSGYRNQLIPYCLCRVDLTAESWKAVKVFGNSLTVQLCLKNVRLSHVYEYSADHAPEVHIDHMQLAVSRHWFNKFASTQKKGLFVNGMLYEYVDSKGQRNIGIMGVTVIPRIRKAERQPIPVQEEAYAV